MAIIWVDPYRGISESFKCHGTTGQFASRNGSYANPYSYEDMWTRYTAPSGLGRIDPVGLSNVSLNIDDEIRIKGEPISHIWLAEQDVTAGIDNFHSDTIATVTGFTNGQKTHILFEPYSTGNSAKNYDVYNTTRPVVSNSVGVTINADSTLTARFNYLFDEYWHALNQSTYSSIGSTLTYGARLLNPAFVSSMADIPIAGASTSTNYLLGVISSSTSNRINQILITDGWSSETVQSNDYFSFCFHRPYTTGTTYWRNYVAHKAPRTYYIQTDNSDAQTYSGNNYARWYEYGAGSDYYANNQDVYEIGQISGCRYFYYYRNYSDLYDSFPTPTTETYGRLANHTFYFYNYQTAYQSHPDRNTDFHLYFHQLSGYATSWYWDNQRIMNSSTSVTRTHHFGEVFFDREISHYNGSNYSTDRDKISIEANSTWSAGWSRISSAFNGDPPPPSVYTWNAPVYNNANIPWDQADGNSSFNSYPNTGVEVTLKTGSGAANLIDLNASNWYDINEYSWTLGQATASYMWFGELQIPANTALEDYVVTSATRTMANGISNHYMGTFTTNIRDDDRAVYFAYAQNGACIVYVNSDGDLDIRPMPDESGNYPYEITLNLYLPIPNYVDANGNATSLSPFTLWKSFHGSGDYYGSYGYMMGRYTASGASNAILGWSGGNGGVSAVNSTTLNTTDWWKKIHSYSASNIQNYSYLPGPWTTPPSAPVDHVMVTFDWYAPTGNNFASDFKFVLRIPPVEEWGDY